MNMNNLLSKLTDIENGSPRKNISEGVVGECGGVPSVNGLVNVPVTLTASASNGIEISSMLKDLMSLAGMNKPTAVELPPAPVEQLSVTNDHSTNQMRKMIDGVDGEFDGIGMDDDDAVIGDEELDEPVESYDNTPADPTDVPVYDNDALAYQPNTGDHRERQKGLSRAMPVEESLQSITTKLYSEYKGYLGK